jgi:hypothetical protein
MLSMIEARERLSWLFTEFLSHSSGDAVSIAVSGVAPTLSGVNVPHIQEIRDWFYENGHSQDLAHGLLVSAPHTHWRLGEPVVMSKKDDYYVIGNQKIDWDAEYTPISFVLTNQGVLPYEWADESIAFEKDEIATVFSVLEAIRPFFVNRGIRLGLGLNFRFKQSLFSHEQKSSRETLFNDGQPDGLGTIREMTEAALAIDTNEFEQVYWHCVSEKYDEMSAEAFSVLLDCEAKLASLPTSRERLAALNDILAKLG